MTDGPHPGDALSSFLDGELDPREHAEVSAHLRGCDTCRRELALVGGGRALLRSLAPVEPPFGLYERLLRAPGVVRRGLVALALSAAAAIAVVTLAAPRPARVRPPVADLVETHAATASVAGDPVTQLVPAGVPVSFQR